MKHITLYLMTALLVMTVWACKDASQSENAQADNAQEADISVADKASLTTIEFKEIDYNFGKIKEGDDVSYKYEFTNTGQKDLVIAKVKGSCGCTVGSKPEQPIPPGESSFIEVTFDSKGKQGSQSKTITVTANTEPANTVLTLRGEITP
jgi:hypothetical protein